MTIRLQIFLVGLFFLAVLGARWWWLERQHRRPVALGGAGAATAADAMNSDLYSSDADADKPAADLDGRQEPRGFDSAFPDLPTTACGHAGVLHPRIDCMAQLHVDGTCEGASILALLPKTRRVGSKTWAIEGFNTDTQCWEALVPQRHYTLLQAGIQLVNRHGALQDIEFSEFVVKTGELAESLGASVEFPEMMAEVARAKELEHFVLGYDVRLSLNLHAKRAAWSLPYVQRQAQKLGFVAGVIPGRWVLGQSEHEMIALTVDVHAAMADNLLEVPIRQLALTLAVPLVARGDPVVGKPFDVMADSAIRLCASMEAVILDEQGLGVDVAALQRTSDELEEVYDRLDSAGLPAGSVLAKRLFS